MTKVAAKKIMVTHPASGVERKFDAAIYEPIKVAILKSLTAGKGKTFSALTKDIIKTMKQTSLALANQFPGILFPFVPVLKPGIL
jgi:hypothetical protein